VLKVTKTIDIKRQAGNTRNPVHPVLCMFACNTLWKACLYPVFWNVSSVQQCDRVNGTAFLSVSVRIYHKDDRLRWFSVTLGIFPSTWEILTLRDRFKYHIVCGVLPCPIYTIQDFQTVKLSCFTGKWFSGCCTNSDRWFAGHFFKSWWNKKTKVFFYLQVYLFVFLAPVYSHFLSGRLFILFDLLRALTSRDKFQETH
jgi:hypothetical protein